MPLLRQPTGSPVFFEDDRAPSAADDFASVGAYRGALWRDRSAGEGHRLWACLDPMPGAALWVPIDGISAADKAKLDTVETAATRVPAGALVKWHPNMPAPSGYLPCDGGTVSRTIYADLFAMIGTRYGDGDGAATFGLPNPPFAQVIKT